LLVLPIACQLNSQDPFPILKSMPLETPLNVAMVVGWVVAFLLAWAFSINSGSVKKSGRNMERQLLARGVNNTWSSTCI